MNGRCVVIALFSVTACAQEMSMQMMNPAGMYLMTMASGTSMNPPSAPMPMLMRPLGSWNLMIMGRPSLSIRSNRDRGEATSCIHRTPSCLMWSTHSAAAAL